MIHLQSGKGYKWNERKADIHEGIPACNHVSVQPIYQSVEHIPEVVTASASGIISVKHLPPGTVLFQKDSTGLHCTQLTIEYTELSRSVDTTLKYRKHLRQVDGPMILNKRTATEILPMATAMAASG